MRRLVLFTLLVGALANSCASAADADLDADFGVGGRAIYDLSVAGIRTDKLHALGPMPGGGYFALASRHTAPNVTSTFVLRLSQTGALLGDVDIGLPTSNVDAATVAPDGTVVVAAPAFLPDNRRGTRVERWLPSGAPDPSFGGGDGQVVVDEPTGSMFNYGIALDAQGGVMVSGLFRPTGGTIVVDDASFAVLLDAGGAPRTSFGGDGIAVVDVAQFNAELQWDIARDAGGRVLLCGGATYSGSAEATVTRLFGNGALDTDFGSGGTAIYDTSTPTENWTDFCRDLEFSPTNGRMLIAVERRNGGPVRGAVRVLRIDDAGEFNGDVPDLLSGVGDYPGRIRLAFDDGGRPLIAATLPVPAVGRAMHIARLTTNLSLDPTFGTGGSQSFPIHFPVGVHRDAYSAVALFTERSRIVLAAWHEPTSADSLWSIQRLKGGFVFANSFE